MKILDTTNVECIERPIKAKSSEGAEATAFQEILSEACQGQAEVSPLSSQAGTTDPLLALTGAGSLARCQTVSRNENLGNIERVSAVLGLLERYQEQLADNRSTLREMMPVVEALEGGLQGLGQLRTQPSLSPDLARIADEVAVTAQVELVKFHRGDYV
jgi:hypothetical protein